jgi:hypothetical protein
MGVSGCVIEPAPPEVGYGGPYAYYDYPVYAHPYYYGGGGGGYWGGGGDRRWR